MADDAEHLEFSTASIDRYGKKHVYIISYDKTNGYLSKQDSSQALYVAILAKLKGAPELTLNHFFGMTTVSESSQVSSFNSVGHMSAMEIAAGWDLG